MKINKIEYVYHIAAIANARRSLENVYETMVNNVAGTSSILNACANSNVKKSYFSRVLWFIMQLIKKLQKKKMEILF